MASAPLLGLAASSDASSTVRLGSWLITDITMLIMTCRRRMLRASCSCSLTLPVCTARCGLSIAPRFPCPSAGGLRQPTSLFWGQSRPRAMAPRCRTSVTYGVELSDGHGGCAGSPVKQIRGEAMPEAGSANKEQRPNPNEKLVRVFDTEQEAEALGVRGLLESAGIDSDVTSLDAPQDILPGVGGTVILVREEEAEKARRMIEEY